MDFLPIFMNLRQRPCLLVGGGEVAVRKLALLRLAEASVTVVSPSLCEALEKQLAEDECIRWEETRFSPQHLDQQVLVIAATDNEAVNVQVSEAAKALNIPVNVVDNPDLCSFIMPSIIDRSPIIAAVSSGGAAPVLARMIRSKLETLIPAGLGRLATLAARFRNQVKAHFSEINQRRLFWEKVLQGEVAELVFAKREGAAADLLEKQLLESDATQSAGEVYLVGGGPGDPELLTFRALRLMQQADVVLHDRLVSEDVLNLTRRDAERIYVGKERDNHTVPQEDINQLLVRLAKSGRRVLRLKGGDPFIFGRGGEEIATLAEEGISFQVVPGITAASGCSSYAGIPLTHRDYSQSCLFVTGNLRDGSVDLNWSGMVQPQQTIVFYMGLQGLPIICEQLICHGMSPDMPAALVQQGTTAQQQVVIGTIASLPDEVKRHQVKAPTLVIVGEVVNLHESLAWFNTDSVAVHG